MSWRQGGLEQQVQNSHTHTYTRTHPEDVAADWCSIPTRPAPNCNVIPNTSAERANSDFNVVSLADWHYANFCPESNKNQDHQTKRIKINCT